MTSRFFIGENKKTWDGWSVEEMRALITLKMPTGMRFQGTKDETERVKLAAPSTTGSDLIELMKLVQQKSRAALLTPDPFSVENRLARLAPIKVAPIQGTDETAVSVQVNGEEFKGKKFLGLLNPAPFSELFGEPIPAMNLPVANAAFLAGSVTRKVAGGVVSAMGETNFDTVKVEMISQTSVKSLVVFLNEASTIKAENSQGLEWCSHLYKWMSEMSVVDRTLCVARIIRVLYTERADSFLRELNEEELKDVGSGLNKADFRNQVKAITVTIRAPKATVATALEYRNVSRAFRGRDASPMSIATMACYGGLLADKEYHVIRNWYSIMHHVVKEGDSVVIFNKRQDQNDAYAYSLMKNKDISPEIEGACRVSGVKTYSVLHDVSGKVVFNMVTETPAAKGKTVSAADYAASLTASAAAMISKFEKWGAKTLVFLAELHEHSIVPPSGKVHYLAHPTPHNMISVVVWNRAADVTGLRESTIEQIADACLKTNLVRNQYMFTRRAVHVSLLIGPVLVAPVFVPKIGLAVDSTIIDQEGSSVSLDEYIDELMRAHGDTSHDPDGTADVEEEEEVAQ